MVWVFGLKVQGRQGLLQKGGPARRLFDRPCIRLDLYSQSECGILLYTGDDGWIRGLSN